MSLKDFICTPDYTISHHFFKIFSGETPRTPTNGRGHPSRTLPTRPFVPRENPPRLSSGSATVYPRIFEILKIFMTHYKTTEHSSWPGIDPNNWCWSAFNYDGTNYLSSHQNATHHPLGCHTRLINTRGQGVLYPPRNYFWPLERSMP